MTVKALLPSPRYTCHDVTYSVLRYIRNLLLNCIFKIVNVREGVSKNLSFQKPPQKKNINSLKYAIRHEISNVTQDTLRRAMASVPGRWQRCLYCHGGHLQDVVLKT
jgi:hypothetical protein